MHRNFWWKINGKGPFPVVQVEVMNWKGKIGSISGVIALDVLMHG